MYCLSEAHQRVDTFLQLTDAIHPQILYSTELDLVPAQNIFKRIARRDLYKLVSKHVLKPDEPTGDLTPQSLKEEELKQLQEKLKDQYGDQYVLSMVSVTNGKHQDPLKHVHFYSKTNTSGPAEPPILPKTNMELPFYQLLVYCRTKSEDNFKSVEDSVVMFLKKLKALKE